ncbi:hypothetical protein BUN12_0013 [Bacillus amyloliquefaciens]|uniref:Uncharacterized protein n=2 Tax=Bacillus amyloliquefaciens TaxID=1390 RepID=A0A9P1JFA0_BACAS|nr:hypothetical protein [Bacillus amyloliquefaciens]AZV88277.1 hypothetical protein BUN12_0013 [Bacillus amyloliquefaciens]MEC1840205.1 hypothetical protein [Bacillus amyloliquefaciens]MEC1848171.1 hypothetical protein [Bacillus amyloliquefaciens]MEC1928088.1 hypothetical protein [Bacillus amyloliquefaciens]MEC2022130.1 hypothetical protein [Bacillus amyloliquefaciens]
MSIISINIYDKLNDTGEDEELEVFSHEKREIVNGYNEQLQTYVLINNISPTGYQNIQIINDEIFAQTVRVKGEVVHQVIKQDMYQAYVKVRDKRPRGVGNLVTLCRKDSSLKTKEILEENFGNEYEQHKFDILKIIDAASDVRNARFKVKIETVSSVSMGGTRVHDTQYYAEMLRKGQLSAVIIIMICLSKQ